MTAIKFKFDGSVKDVLTWDDIEILEEGRIGKAKNILARFIVDENDKPIPFEEAKKQLGKLKMGQIEETMQAFTVLMKEEAIPPQTAVNS